MTPPRDAGGDPDRGAQPAPAHEQPWHFRLYVVEGSAKCLRAIANLERACAHWLPGHYHIEVIDLAENPRLAIADQVIAVPTLFRRHPPPVCKIVGDLSDTERLLVDMQLRPGPPRLTNEHY